MTVVAPGSVGRFRFAPTPSRPLHIGSALAALLGWSFARNAGGRFVLRIEDIDRTRSQRVFEDRLLADLSWLGLDWDEGPDVGGPNSPYRQSERLDLYDEALEVLAGRGHLYACTCSRADIRAAQSAPHLGLGEDHAEVPYPGRCRPPEPTLDPARALAPDRGGLRLALRSLDPPGPVVAFEDAGLGHRSEDLRETCGDFLLGRPGQPTYQLAVVVDDLAMGISDVVRGRDLLASTARQIVLAKALGGRPPRYRHHGLILGPEGRKLSKRDAAPALSDLVASERAEHLIAALGRALGLMSPTTREASAHDFRESLLARPTAATQDATWAEGAP